MHAQAQIFGDKAGGGKIKILIQIWYLALANMELLGFLKQRYFSQLNLKDCPG